LLKIIYIKITFIIFIMSKYKLFLTNKIIIYKIKKLKLQLKYIFLR
jgi:hypothetical protein